MSVTHSVNDTLLLLGDNVKLPGGGVFGRYGVLREAGFLLGFRAFCLYFRLFSPGTLQF